MAAIVRLALSRPYTFVVMSILILLFGGMSIVRTPTDIFHQHRHPGHQRDLELHRFAGRRHVGPPSSPCTSACLTATVNDIEHIESQSVPGYGIVKIYFQPTVDVSAAQAPGRVDPRRPS